MSGPKLGPDSVCVFSKHFKNLLDFGAAKQITENTGFDLSIFGGAGKPEMFLCCADIPDLETDRFCGANQ